MLNGDTKRKIQGARDILVGKIPVPTAQVEQITLALMYKFMSDMDEQAKKLGDKTGFFMGEYEKYSWNKITDTSLSAYDRVALYSEGLEKMNNNPNVPQLFRDIFKGAFLPFKDPETLKLFLDQINEIEYTHSEDLGDAYEYLLSVMGSQGDAGQFRTPRHIIDFIVEIVDPKKEDKILDPACGTAGFLISAYKHILKHNTTKDSKILGDALSPMDRRNLTRNFVGYDISHEMRRLSLVNMYLHQFPDPQIYEYDTLTSTDHWDEDFDCILANPPFMTPRGGIRPHHRFAVQANRAEVLFVDYIMEHLSTSGKAGIIVPEGIVFQSSNAYKNLRKLLVEDNYLWAVVSLPAGVFQPYSGVKTSVLLLDKNIAKKTDKILFVNVEGDGFDLGAQRRENGKNDLPSILESLKKYKEWVLNDKEINEDELFNTNIVGKSRIKESGDYNLSGNRYQSSERGLYVEGKWEIVELGEVCDVRNGYAFKSSGYCPDGVRVLRITNVQNGVITDNDPKFYKSDSQLSKYLLKSGDLLISLTGNVGRVGLVPSEYTPAYLNQRVGCIDIKDDKLIVKKYLFHILNNSYFENACVSSSKGVAQKNLSTEWLKGYKIPLPPIEEQKKIVEELDRYQRIIDGARMVIDNWKPEIEIDPEWQTRKLGEACLIDRGGSPRPIEKYITEDPNGFNWIKIGDTKDSYKYITQTKQRITLEGTESSRKVEPGDFILSNSMSFGNPYIMKIEGYIHDGWLRLKVKEDILDKEYLYYILSSDIVKKQFENAATGGVVRNLNSKLVRNVEIPLPSIDIQRNIVKQINKLEESIKKNSEIIDFFEKKSADVISKIFNG